MYWSLYSFHPSCNNDSTVVAHICCISLLNATITTSIWLVKRKTFVNDTYYLKGTENYCLDIAWLFCWKLLSYSLTALERRRQFLSKSHLVSENKSIDIWVIKDSNLMKLKHLSEVFFKSFSDVVKLLCSTKHKNSNWTLYRNKLYKKHMQK